MNITDSHWECDAKTEYAAIELIKHAETCGVKILPGDQNGHIIGYVENSGLCLFPDPGVNRKQVTPDEFKAMCPKMAMNGSAIGTYDPNGLLVNTEIDFDFVGAFPPYYSTERSAGLDLRCQVETVLPSREVVLVGTGMYVKMPLSIEMQIRNRSSLAMAGILVRNAPGTIDSDYDKPADEVKVMLYNDTNNAVAIAAGEKIAQAVFSPVTHAPKGYTKDTKKRDGGFGSTGKQ